jgi:ABC-type branched-subunit amino acid transport system ATPase component
MTTTAITVERLTKRYGATTAVDDLSFAVPAGSVTGFLGPNGAGKSTTLRALLGLTRPTAGRATFDGVPYGELADPARIVPTLLATPRRGRVVAAAALANVLTGAVIGLASTVTAVLGTTAVLALTGTDPAVAAAGVAAAVAGGTAWAALAALLGFGVGAVARNQPLAVAMVSVLLLALDQVLASGLPEVVRWLPRHLGAAVAAGRLDGEPGALAAGAVLAAYGVALTVGGWVAVRATEAR